MSVALPTPLRTGADDRFRGRGVAIALVDAAFHPHPDLVRPTNRVRAWVDASTERMDERWFEPDDVPVWPEMPPAFRGAEWHGLMTSVTAAGNGWLSQGQFRGIASESEVVLLSASDGTSISNDAIARALRWVRHHAVELGVRVVSLSVSGDDPPANRENEIDDEVEALVADGIVVVAAAGNDGIRRLLPPAASVEAITVGGVDDHNALNRTEWDIWHSNYGVTSGLVRKPELLAPSQWTVAPVLPGSDVAKESRQLFAHRGPGKGRSDARIAELKLITPYYHHVEGTSVAAPIVASVVACMFEANPELTPERVKELLMKTATRIRGDSDRQGAGAVDAGRAVAAACQFSALGGDAGEEPLELRFRPHPIELGFDGQEHQPA
jgi:serine protease AprX